MIFYTIGVYNLTEEHFFEKLTSNNIDLFIDIRQRRGVRGAKYKFVNSIGLQEKLKILNIDYLYIKDLAPTSEVRDIQKLSDKDSRESKKQRINLSCRFIDAYKEFVIAKFDFNSFINILESQKANNIVLFCVEEFSTACHRSIVTEELIKLGFQTRNL